MKDPVQKLLNDPPIVLNLGLIKFAESLDDQDLEVLHVDWSPPAGGDQEMIDLLDHLL
jgi:FdrA protein